MSIEQGGGRNRRVIAIVIALIVAAGAAVGLILVVNSQTGSNSSNVNVVVTVNSVAMGAKIGAGDVAVRQVPSAAVPADALTTTDQAVGQFATVALQPNTVVTQGDLAGTASQVPAFARLNIPDNYVAVAIPNSTSQGVNGYIQPEDHIDIIGETATGSTRYFFQDIRVLAINGPGTAASGGSSSLLVVAVPRAQAEELVELMGLQNNKSIKQNQDNDTCGPSTPCGPVISAYVLRNLNQSYKVDPKKGPGSPNYLPSGSTSPVGSIPPDTPIDNVTLSNLFPG